METPATTESQAVPFDDMPHPGSPIFWLELALNDGLRAQICDRAAFNSRNRRTERSEPLFFAAFALNEKAQREWDRHCGRELSRV